METKKLQNSQKFIILLVSSLIALVVLIILSIFIGAEKSITFKDFVNALFHYNEENFNETIIRNIRIPRLIADIMVGACLAIAGAIMQGTTKNPRYGNPLPRIAECSSGLINAIGLQNPGIDKVISEELPKLRKCFKKPIVANISGFSKDEYVECCEKIDKEEQVEIIELNVSCP